MHPKTASDPMATLYHEGRHTFVDLVPDGGARLDTLFHTAPALGELAVGVVYGHLHAALSDLTGDNHCQPVHSKPQGIHRARGDDHERNFTFLSDARRRTDARRPVHPPAPPVKPAPFRPA